MSKPLAIDLFCGLGGWTEGLLSAGYRVVGFDIQRHVYAVPADRDEILREVREGAKGAKPFENRGWTQSCAITLGMEGPEQRPRTRMASYPAQLVLQDVLTICGSQFRDAALIVASPPCQNYSYLAMPWSRSKDPENSKAAKALRNKWETEGPDNRLFDACFRIQREACEAAGRYIPMVVENVRGAQPWVGPAKANYGSFFLWGDVAMVGNRIFVTQQVGFGRGLRVPGKPFKGGDGSWFAIANNTNGHSKNPVHALERGEKINPDGTNHPQGSWFRIADSSQGDRGVKVPGQVQGKEYAMCRTGAAGQKVLHYSDPRRNGGKGVHLTSPAENEGTKIGGDWFSDPNSTCRKHGSRSNARKAASAMIAKIPLPLSQYVARAFLS